MIQKTLILAVVAAFLAGCNDTAEPVQTVEWYKEHKAEREATRKRCHDNPGQLATTPNCINADKAQSAVDGAKRGTLNVQPMTGIKLGGK
ncbi:EexN family lipoprotein [Tepidimonas sp.]|uniref:EexN family lipoprotein n=1 Tax=Tepidimonas sp. TaxID=2002775 RepID=UPI00391C677A